MKRKESNFNDLWVHLNHCRYVIQVQTCASTLKEDNPVSRWDCHLAHRTVGRRFVSFPCILFHKDLNMKSRPFSMLSACMVSFIEDVIERNLSSYDL
jgi:hypothetical protein